MTIIQHINSKYMTGVDFAFCYTGYEMVKAIRREKSSLSSVHPVLTGDSHRDWSLWQLSNVLAEIAGQAAIENNPSADDTEKLTSLEIMGVQAFPRIKDG